MRVGNSPGVADTGPVYRFVPCDQGVGAAGGTEDAPRG